MSDDQFCSVDRSSDFFIMSVVVFLNCWHTYVIFPEKTSVVSRFGRQSVGRLPVHSLPIVDRLKHHRCSPSIVVQRLIDSLPLLLFVFMVLWKHLMLILCSDQIFRPTKWKKNMFKFHRGKRPYFFLIEWSPNGESQSTSGMTIRWSSDWLTDWISNNFYAFAFFRIFHAVSVI